MTNDTCSSCYGQRGGAVAHAETPVFVDVRTSLRAETFKAFRAVADARGVTVALLLSRMADASLGTRPEPKWVGTDVDATIRELNALRWSDNRISKHIGLTQSSVSRRRREMGLESPTPRFPRKAGA
ncbi:hypothetical protein ACIPVB_09090 [Microbacterium sp. NPDC090007]|uniref:hypothetical protein n=1 Tax=Microbacterium sp. NPDC090007 TaxID=3364204 RepID=UPI003824FB2F